AAVLALFVILTLLAAASKEQWMAYFLGVVSIIILSMLIFQLFGGPSCKVLITTLNSKDSILFAYRFHKTLQILKRIRPMIEAGQGGVSRNETIDKLIGTSATPTQNEGAEPETE
ncbi:MAG: hypothetical protein KAG97_07780, partial [Victivallales bacterium]|nr:hypothetical protein [Victivallales bacterium]